MTAAVWRDDEPAGERRFVVVGDLALTSGEMLPDVRLAYETHGTFTGDNAVLIEHALTGDSHVAGPAGPGHPTPGWWDPLIGPGRAFDTDRFFIVAPNILGGCQGSTGPVDLAPDGAPWADRFPVIAVRDQVAAEVALAEVLGIRRWHAVIGGSAGGMRALEWAVGYPDRVERLLVLATSAAASAEQIALSSIQIDAIRADPVVGLDLARRIAHVSYRCESELQTRFGRERTADAARFEVESYLRHHGAKLSARFDPWSYVTLSEAMNRHDVGAGRGGVAGALGRITARTVVAGIDTDRLYPLYQQVEIAAGIAGAGEVRVVHSAAGHDGFLIEHEQVGHLVADLLAR